ncbi:hypothetical protein EV145_105260 [Flavobacterium sp. 245]|nr:hypothetical protein EV145_105260 [Flavobacterium sp. 245]
MIVEFKQYKILFGISRIEKNIYYKQTKAYNQ